MPVKYYSAMEFGILFVKISGEGLIAERRINRQTDRQTDRKIDGWQMIGTCEILDRRTEIRRKVVG